MDAMVTARMPQWKKEAVGNILSELDTNPSQAINEFYDYLMKYKKLPYEEAPRHQSTLETQKALDYIRSIPLPQGNRFSTMTDDEIKRERMIKRGYADESMFQ